MGSVTSTATAAAARLLRLLCGLLLLVAPLTLPGPAAHAAEAAVTVTLTSLTPSTIQPSGNLVFTGEVTNTSSAPINSAKARLWRSRPPITNPDAIANAVATQPDSPVGAVVRSEAATADLTAEGPLGPGERRAFTVAASFDSGDDPLRLTSTGVAYLVGVVVHTGGYSSEVLGRARVLMPAPDPADPVQVGTVVLLTSQPSLQQGASIIRREPTPVLFTDDHLADELTGRLGSLLTLAEASGSTVVIDPALYDEVTGMAGGYAVLNADGSTTPGTGQAAARAWLQRVNRRLELPDAYRCLFGNPDVSKAQASEQPGVLADATAAVAGHPLAALPLAVIPAANTTDPDLLDFLAPATPALVFADTIGTSRLLQRSGNTNMIGLAPDSFGGGPGPEPATTAVQVAGRHASQQVVSWAQGLPAVSVVSTDAEVAAELDDAPWRMRVGLTELTERRPAADVAFKETDDAKPADPAWLQRLADVVSGFQTASELTAETNETNRDTHQLVARAWHTAFSSDPAAGTRWLDAVDAPLRQLVHGTGVQLLLAENWVMSADTQELPITLTNNFAVPIKVRVTFESEYPQRLRIDPTELLSLGAGESVTVKVKPQAFSSGKVQLQAQAVTVTGTSVGAPVRLTVSATSSGRVAWLIIVGSGVVLLAATALRVTQVRRTRAAAAGPAPAPADVAQLLPGRNTNETWNDRNTGPDAAAD